MGPQERAVVGREAEHRVGRQRHHLLLAVHLNQQRRRMGVRKLKRLPDHRSVALAKCNGARPAAAGEINQRVFIRQAMTRVTKLQLGPTELAV